MTTPMLLTLPAFTMTMIVLRLMVMMDADGDNEDVVADEDPQVLRRRC